MNSDATESPERADSSPAQTRPEPDEFDLYDLRVEVVAGELPMVCNHPVGAYFEVRGEELHFPDGQSFPLYSLAAILPLLPAKQRETTPADWMSTDHDIACPDPLCGGRFRITRIGKRRFRHGDVSAVSLQASSAEDSAR